MTTKTRRDRRPNRDDAKETGSPLGWLLVIAALASIGTGVFWNAMGFIAKHSYEFTQETTLLLYLVMGVIYTVGAFRAGVITRFLQRWFRPRTVLAGLIGLEGILCLGPLATKSAWMLWVTTGGVSLAMSVMWPLLESYLTAGRHGTAMRRAIGWFNLTWMTAVTLPFFLMPPILAAHAEWTIVAQSGVFALAVVPVFRLRPQPAHHDAGEATAHVPGEYRHLLGAARVLLPMSYVLMAALSPVLPYRFEAIGTAVELETPATSTWMIARIVTMLVMWRSGFWHGRWGTLLLAGVSMSVGFAVVVLAPSLPSMLAGFALFGVGAGAIYYTALYYAMAVGGAAVDAGGTHEGLIGAGYAVGPVAGLAGSTLAGGAGIVAVLLALSAASAVACVRPYRRARRARRD